jgi:hypothetical protein
MLPLLLLLLLLLLLAVVVLPSPPPRRAVGPPAGLALPSHTATVPSDPADANKVWDAVDAVPPLLAAVVGVARACTPPG